MPQVALPPGKNDEDFVLGLLRETGILCVYGSGFGLPARDGFFRVVFLASPDELSGAILAVPTAAIVQVLVRRNALITIRRRLMADPLLTACYYLNERARDAISV